MDRPGGAAADVHKDRLTKGAEIMSRKELEHQDMARSYYFELAIVFIVIQVLFG